MKLLVIRRLLPIHAGSKSDAEVGDGVEVENQLSKGEKPT